MNISTSASDIFNQISNLCYICQEPIKKPVTVLEFRNCQDQIKNIEAVEGDIKEISPSTVQGFLFLYENIDQAEKLIARSEKNMIHAKKEVILSYYHLGKADAEKVKELLKIPTPLRIAQNKIVADIKKLLSSNTSINVIKKRIATA
ncbi:30052_t:CDS:2 [Gigaspora margarita]|uniref:30052_t:CDS:1 n=1 Tax=Gigaspora margarita TaxID=4874 RepID=A0ABN7V0Z5_GIGMA|nr:30052_t:CDS:2 [Gigaspora margarita]